MALPKIIAGGPLMIKIKIIVIIMMFWFLFYGLTYSQKQIEEIQEGVVEPVPEMIHEMGHPFEVVMEIMGMIECNAWLRNGIGLGKISVIEYRDGSESSITRKVPADFKIDSIEIMIDLRNARPIFDWFKKWTKKKGNKKNVKITIINPHSEEKYHINMVQSWPSQLRIILDPPHQPRLLIYFEADDVLI